MTSNRLALPLKSLALAAGLFLLLELALAGLGIGGLDRVRDSRGYDPDATYMLPSAEVPGRWILRLETDTRGSIPPRGQEPRWVIVGASTAASWGRTGLEKAAEGVGLGSIEVLNLGRPGFCSGRVMHILDQAVENLDPDLILIYGGDNEFLEQPPELRADAAVQRGGGAIQLARRSRVFNALLGLARGRDVHDDGRPEEFVPMDTRLQESLDLAENHERLEMLRENLRTMCRRARDADVRLVLSTIVYNRFSGPRQNGPVSDHPPKDRRRFATVRNRINKLLPDYLAPLLPKGRNSFLRSSDWNAKAPRGAPQAQVDPEDLPRLRACVGPLEGYEPALGRPSLWKQRAWDVLGAYERLFEGDGVPEERAILEELEQLLSEALELRPSDPRSTFELGLVLQLLGRDPARIAKVLDRAADLDRVPRKGSPSVNTIIREVAAEFPEVLLFDADALAVSGAPEGLVGWELMVDHCHLQKPFIQFLRGELAAAIAKRWPE